MKNLLSLLLLATLFITSCGSDDGTKADLTSEEASAKILATGELAAADVVSITDSEGVSALMAFADLFADFDQFSSREEQNSWIKKKFQIISQYFVTGPAGRVNEGEFVFDDIKGVFDWNPELEEFERTADSDFFIVNFPSEGSATNNAELKITNLEFVTITESDEFGTYEEEYPTAIDGTLKVDGETFISLTASANWSNDGAPEKGSIDLLISPYTFKLDFDDTNNLSLSGSASLSKDDAILMAVDLKIDFKTTLKEDPTTVSGFVQYSNVKLSGSVDAAGIEENEYDANDEPNPNFDINDYVDLDLLIDDVKAGDIVFEEDIAYIIYLDGTKENLEELLEAVIADIEESLEQFEEEDVID